jgi:hypothetical protein
MARTAAWVGVLLAAALVLPGRAAAQSAAQTDPGGLIDRLAGLTEDESISLGGVGFFRWLYQIDGEADDVGRNTFEMWRLYLTFKARMTDWLSLRITSDVGPEPSQTATTASPDPAGDPPPDVPDHTHDVTVPGDQSYSVFLKFAYFDVALPGELSIQAGIIPSVWTGRLDDFWGFRFVAKESIDEERLINTADLGVQLGWKMPLGLGETVVAFVNGTGFRAAIDGDEYKTLQARVTFTPLASCCELLKTLELGGLVSTPLGQDEPRNVFAAFIGYKHEWFRLGYQFFYQDNQSTSPDQEGMGHAVYFRFQTPWGVGALGRFHIWDADTGSDSNMQTMRLYAGIFYTPVRFLTIAATDAITWRRDGDEASVDPATINTFLLSSEFRF